MFGWLTGKKNASSTGDDQITFYVEKFSTMMIASEQELFGRTVPNAIEKIDELFNIKIPNDIDDPQGRVYYDPHFPKISIVFDIVEQSDIRSTEQGVEKGSLCGINLKGQDELFGFTVNGNHFPDASDMWTPHANPQNPLSQVILERLVAHPRWSADDWGGRIMMSRADR